MNRRSAAEKIDELAIFDQRRPLRANTFIVVTIPADRPGLRRNHSGWVIDDAARRGEDLPTQIL